jgi:predicted transcriptional regulator
MSDTERKLLQALARMAAQYLVHHAEDTELDSAAMSAGEHALSVLAQYGLVALKGGHRIRGDWTEAGRRFLEEAWRA